MVWTPIPRSAVRWVRNLVSGGLLDVLWWSLITLVIVIIAYVLAQMGVIGGVIAGSLLATLISDNVRAYVRDVYSRNFWRFNP
ncbi:hypothetical protein [Salinigranum rubrum]|nr:hypothetical protein [Salinigranum rubrum]